MSVPERPNTFSFTCSDLIHQLRSKLQRMIEHFGDIFLPRLDDSILLQFMGAILNGYLNAYYVDSIGFLAQHVFQRQNLHSEHLRYLEEEVAAPASTCLAARSTLPVDWINRPPERRYDVQIWEEQQGFCIAWTV